MLTAHSTLDGLSLFTAPAALHQHDRHAHDCLSVIMLTSGRKSYSIEGRRLPVHAGQIAIANPGEVHGCEYVGGQAWSHRTWYVSPQLLARVSAEAGLKRPAEIGHAVLDSAAHHAQLVQAHAAAQAQGDGANELDREAAALAALMCLLTHFGSERPAAVDSRSRGLRDPRSRVRRCTELINERWRERLDLAMLAHEAGVSAHHVIRNFQQVLHLTPGEYLRSVRLARGKQLIAQGQPLAEVALSTGFSDQSHFSRTFKRVHGFTPSAFAAAARRRWWMRMI
jgi:AraC-like DNA-binding protein